MRKINKIVIHCAYTPHNMDIDSDWIRDIHVNQNGWCFPLYTEVLTDSGWKNYESIQSGDLVYTLGKGFTDKWSKLFWKNNEVVCMDNSNFSGHFTKNHKMVFRSAYSKNKEFKKTGTVEEFLSSKTVKSVLTSSNFSSFENKNYEIDYELAAVIVADGWFNYSTLKRNNNIERPCAICFNFKKDRKAAYVTELLDRLKIKHSISSNKPDYTHIYIGDKRLVELYHKELCREGRGSKSLQWDFLNIPTKDKLKILNGYLETDGIKDTSPYKESNKYQIVASANKKNIDILQAILHTTSKRGKLSEIQRTCPKTGEDKNLYVLTINDKVEVQVDKRNLKVETSISDVWCIDTGGDFIMVRNNGCVHITGNSSIGYHYIIPQDGEVEVGRPESVAGAHVRGHNADSIGICLVGGKSRDKTGSHSHAANFTHNQWESLRNLVLQLLVEYPDAEVLGHCDLDSSKPCPNFDVKAWAKGLV